MKINELKKFKKIILTDSEKKNLFNRISDRISKEDSKIVFHYPTPSPFFRFSFLLHGRYLVGVLTLLILSITSATAFASLNALPGDLLYGVKTNIVEKIPLIFQFNSESRARYNYEKIQNRIDEFEKLAEKNRLTKKNTEKIQKNIDENFRNFDKNISEIKKHKKEESKEKNKLEVELESNLKKRSEKIEKIRQNEKLEDKQALQSVIERAHYLEEKDKKEKDLDKNLNKLKK